MRGQWEGKIPTLLEVVVVGETERVDRKDGLGGGGGGDGKGGFLHVWRGGVETGKGGLGNGEGDFTDEMPGWRYFSRATLGQPASGMIK